MDTTRPDQPARRFRYDAQTRGGIALTGTVEAPDQETARDALADTPVRMLTLEAEPPATPRPLRGDDFFAFNQQLAQLTDAGLPIESGLRLIAQDMRRGRLAASIKAVADDLDRGRSLPEAFEQHRKLFPPLYARLVDAGIRGNRLSGVLLNLSRHLETMRRLRSALWQALAYPLVVSVVLVLVLGGIGLLIVPEFRELYADFGTELPLATQVALAISDWTLALVAVFFGVLLGLPLLGWAMARLGHAGWLRDTLLIRLPLLGPALRRNMMARWCDLLRQGVAAGLNLPEALELTSQAIGSRPIQHDTARLIDTVSAGQPLDAVPRLDVVPASVPASMQLASDHADLAAMLGDLATMYEQQADLRLNTLQVMLAPIVLILIGGVVAATVLVLFLPLVKITSSLI